MRRHADFVHAVTGIPGRAELDCLHCHAGAGHGAGGSYDPNQGGVHAPERSEGSARAPGSSSSWWGGIAGLTVLLLALLTNIFERRQEARQPFVRGRGDRGRSRGAELGDQYDSYLLDLCRPRRIDGGRGPGASDAGPADRLDRDPWLTRIFAGYAFALDYRDRAFALFDQEQTLRVTERKQPGAAPTAHASNLGSTATARAGRRHEGVRGETAYVDARNIKDESGL